MKEVWEKMRKGRNSWNHKQNIKEIYNEKLRYTCRQQVPTIKRKTKDLRK